MEILQSVIAAKVTFILGIINLVSGILILLSCRCMAGARIGESLMKYSAYKGFFKYHCYIWWVFWTSVIIHAIFALAFYGIPF
ncbi:hypothetical protein ACFLYM_01735 [Chloroflexota bacterium]